MGRIEIRKNEYACFPLRWSREVFNFWGGEVGFCHSIMYDTERQKKVFALKKENEETTTAALGKNKTLKGQM